MIRFHVHGPRLGAAGRLAAILLIGLFGASGCVHYRARPIVPGRTANEFEARTLSDQNLHRFMLRAEQGRSGEDSRNWPLPTWTLDDLTLAADFFQPGLGVARAEWDVANAATLTARQRPNPSIDASGTYDTTTAPPWIPAVAFDIPLETAGKRGYRLARTQAAAEAARWDLVGKVWQVRAGVRSAMLELFAARQTAVLLARQEEAEANEVRLVDGQVRAGALAASELMTARIALDTTRLNLQQARGHEETALAALAAAVGVPTEALRQLPLSFAGLDTFPTTPPAPGVRRAAVLDRADVRGALADYAASQAALQLEIANQYPDVHLGPGYELDQTDNKWTLGLTLTLPILNQNQGPIAEARATRRLAAARFIDVQARAISETESALAGYKAAMAQAKTAAALEEGLQRRLDSTRAMERAGEVDPLSVAAAEVEYINGAIQHLDALVAAQQAFGALEAAVQSPEVISKSVLSQAEAASHPESVSHEP